MQRYLWHAGVQEEGCLAIGNLPCDSDARCDAPMAAGAARALADAMQDRIGNYVV